MILVILRYYASHATFLCTRQNTGQLNVKDENHDEAMGL